MAANPGLALATVLLVTPLLTELLSVLVPGPVVLAAVVVLATVALPTVLPELAELADCVAEPSACISSCMKLCRSLASCAGVGPVLAEVAVPLAAAVLEVVVPVADVERVALVLEAICCCSVSNSAPMKPLPLASALLADGAEMAPDWLCALLLPWVAGLFCAAVVLDEANS